MAETLTTLGTGYIVLLRDEAGLVVEALCTGTPATTASVWAVGARVTDRSQNVRYTNIGTTALPVWFNSNDGLQVAVATLAPADIIATTAGSLSHAQGLTLVAAPGANFFLELVSCTVSFTFATAVYTGGAGNVTVNIGGGGAALTGLVTGANSFIKASSNINQFVPLSTAANSITANTALSLVTTAAFTQPGTAAGTARIVTVYRTHSI